MLEALPHILYVIIMILAGFGWLALVFFPRHTWANFWFSGLVMPIVLGLFYTGVMAVFWFQPPQGRITGFFSLTGLSQLFMNAGLLLAGFIDLMVMPLLVGAWMARKATQINMPYVYLLPCLIITLVLPGTGFVVFAVIIAAGGWWTDISILETQRYSNRTIGAVTTPGAA